MKFSVIIADPPYRFKDELSMAKTKRGASANYDTLSIEDLKNLNVKEICEDDAILVLWVPSTLLSDGLDIMKAWGFRQTQTHIWVKTKQDPLKSIQREITKAFKAPKPGLVPFIKDILSKFNANNLLAFGMGRLFRQTHELALIGVRGKIYNHLENKSQRSVHFFPATKHSVKPELLQDMLEKMFPKTECNKLELFARRQKRGWYCLGNEVLMSKGEDIRKSLSKLKGDMSPFNDLIYSSGEEIEKTMQELWSRISSE
jgi:N6-adenosine-specific RNA methylase IME4